VKAAGIESDARRYLTMPYTRELVREDDGSWFARILEFPGCMTVGDTREDALEMLDDAMLAWVEAKLQDRQVIPVPMTAAEFSGRFVVRLTKSLHRDLVRAAERNGVSLNQYVVTMLAQSTAGPQISALRKDYGSAKSPLQPGRKKS
jgi:antitoxin HicB